MRLHLPQGRGLPPAEFERRHAALLGLLWFCGIAMPVFSMLHGYDAGHAALHAAPLAAFALVASVPRLGDRLRAACCALGLLSATAALIHASHGLTEAHFGFFVVIVCLTIYEDWVPFLTAVAFVLLHHGVFGMIEPEAVYSGESLDGSPWKWAAVHALFVTAAGTAAIAVWSLNENLRAEKEELIARLSALSHEDQLTGLPNRRAWEQHFAAEMSRARRMGSPLSVVMLDIDNLKVVNDELGHEAGDRLLRSATAAWKEAVRQNDFIARLGGDEFAVLMSDCDTTGAAAVAQRMLDGMPPDGTVSAGIATWDGEEPAQALVKRADLALYAAKDAGRGRLAADRLALVSQPA